MISTSSIARLFFNQGEAFDTFMANHESFSVIDYLSFSNKLKASKSQMDGFHEIMKQLNIPVTNAMKGVIEWPYIHNGWEVRERLNAIAQHYAVVTTSTMPEVASLHQEGAIALAQFSPDYDNIKVVLDRPKWFIREGELVINLFHQDIRVASIAFTLSQLDNETVAYVGAVQGIHNGIPSDQSLAIYKKLTKLFAGLRPRTLLLEILKVFLQHFDVSKLYGISEENRHHRHAYFGFDQNTEFKNDYNTFWEEHGARFQHVSGFYSVPMAAAIRDLAQVSSKKRSQYRRRNALLASLPSMLATTTNGLN